MNAQAAPRARIGSLVVALFAVFAVVARPAGAQTWDFDARTIALGGVSGSGTLASDMIQQEAAYRAIVLPFGLFQVLPDLDIYDPGSPRFDPVRAVEHAASPLHFIVDRDNGVGDGPLASTIAAAQFYADRANGAAAPGTHLDLGGIVAPNWGGTFIVGGGRDGDYHGVYVGAGPYATARGAADLDARAVPLIVGAPAEVPAGPLTIITTRSQEQAALAITGGYRGRFRWSDDASTRDGVYVAVNYNYLIGLWYVDDNLGVQIDPADVVIDRVSATSGRGMAVDTGAGIVIGRWEFGGGVNGVGNRIHWRGVSHRTIASGNLLTGGLLGQPGVVSARPDVEVSVPVDLRGNLAYRAEGWMAVAEIGHGIVGSTAHAGVEARVAPAVTVRGGLAYSFGDWNPTGGLGVDISRRFGVDVAAFATTANFERRRKLALAASIRVMS